MLLVAALALPAVSSAVTPVGAPVGAPQQFTTFTPSTTTQGSYPTVTYSPTSRKVMGAWFENVTPTSQAPSGTIVRAAFMGSDGTLASTPVDVSTTLSSRLMNYGPGPVVTANPDGTWLISWFSQVDPNDLFSRPGFVAGQILDAGGNPSGSNLVLSSNTYPDGLESLSAAWSPEDQRYLVSWRAQVRTSFPGAANNQQLAGRFVDAGGVGVGSDFLVTNTADGVNDASGLAYGNGRWIAVSMRDTDDRPVGQVVTSAGPQGGIFDLSSSAGTGMAPDITYNSATQQFAATFRATTSPGSEYMRLLDSSGSPVGSNIDLGGTGQRASIASAGSLGYLVSWHRGSGYVGVVYGVRVLADGTVPDAPVAMSDPAPVQAARPKSAYLPDFGRFLTVFNGRASSTAPDNFWNNYSRVWSLGEERVTVALDGNGRGDVTSSPTGIDCGSVCSALFGFGASVTLTASPQAGSTFSGWGGACSGAAPTCTVTMDQAREVVATFSADSPGPGPSPGPTPGPTPSNAFTAVSAAGSSGSLVTVARVPSAGKVRQVVTRVAGGRRVAVCSTPSTTASGPGRVRLSCKVNRATRSAQKKGRVRLRVRVTYTPTGGTARTLTRYVTLRSLKPKYTG